MAGGDKRAKLLSDLMAAKGGSSVDADRSGEADHASVIQIARRRLSEDRAAETPAAPGVLYSKGAATASTFRPSYWSFDHDEQAPPSPEPAKVEAPEPQAPSVAPSAPVPKSKPLPVNFVIGFGSLALVISTTLFVLSFWHRAETPGVQSQPPALVSAPVPPAVQLPQRPPVEPVVAAVSPVPPPALSAPPSAAAPAVSPPSPVGLAPPISPASPALVDPPPAPTPNSAAPPAEPPSEPASVGAAPASNPQADALLARGDDLLATGDVSAARLFYQRAAEQGSPAAATAVGQTYDPAVLELLRVRGARGDAQIAAEWYRKAIAAGDRQAEIRLKRLLARTPG